MTASRRRYGGPEGAWSSKMGVDLIQASPRRGRLNGLLWQSATGRADACSARRDGRTVSRVSSLPGGCRRRVANLTVGALRRGHPTFFAGGIDEASARAAEV